jgi:MFS family permease
MNRLFRSLFAINFLISLGFAMLDPFFPIYIKDAGIGGIHFAAIFSVYTLSRMILSPWIGLWSDGIGRRSFIFAGLGLNVCVALLYLCAPSVPLLIVTRFLQGVASAFFRTVVMALVGDQSPREKEGLTIGTFDISFYSSLALGPVIGAIVKIHFGMSGIFIALSVTCLLSFLLAVFLMPDIHKEGGIQHERLRIGYTALVKNKVFFGLLCFIFTRAIGISLFTIFMPLFMKVNLGLDSLRIGVIMASGTVLMTLFLMPMGILSDRRNRRILVVTGGFLISLLTCCLPLTSGFWYLLLVTVLLGLVSATSLPASAAILMEEGDRYGMGLAFGLFNMTMNLGSAVAPFLGNIVMDLAGLPPIFYLAGFIGFAGVVIFYIYSVGYSGLHSKTVSAG